MYIRQQVNEYSIRIPFLYGENVETEPIRGGKKYQLLQLHLEVGTQLR